MNLILLHPDDFIEPGRVRLRGRRYEHVRDVHRAAEGDRLVVGLENSKVGTAVIEVLTDDLIEMDVSLDGDPPQPLPLTLLVALPRPKVLNRVIVAATSLGVKRLILMNCWRVEKSFWETPRLDSGNLRAQAILGLEQARDTVAPTITIARRFTPFVEDELPEIVAGTLALVGHPPSKVECPRNVPGPVTLAIGPEGGFIENEIAMLERLGFQAVSLGPRILRVETAIAALLGRLF
jgi:RsmE family RNA methyltransferase